MTIPVDKASLAVRRVSLIYPSARRYSGYLSTHRFPGLVTSHSGLSLLAQMLQRRGIAARVYDEKITPFQPALVDGADLVGLSVQTSWAPQAYRLAAEVRRMAKPVVLGGVHVSLNPDEAIRHADFVVRGEGEHAICELVEALAGTRRLDDVDGLSFHREGRVVHNKDRAPMGQAELDALPWPRLDMIEGIDDVVRYPVNRGIYFTMATRGCDQLCNYCSIIRVFGRALRSRSVKSVIHELKWSWDRDRQFLFFMDDSLAVDKDYLKALLQALIDEDLVPRRGWHSQMRADVARDAELLGLMKRTNCTFVTCGFESINQASLKSLQKGQSPKDIVRAISRLHAHDIIVNGFFMFGTDHDTPATMGETVEFARASGCLLAGFMPLTPFPGTPTFTALESEGRIFTKDWELYDVQHVVYRPKQMSAWDLYWRTLACYPKFYAGRQVLNHVRLLAHKRYSAGMIGIGLTWPFLKGASWLHELVANVDYMRALRQASHGRPFPDLADRDLWFKDAMTARAFPQVRSFLP